MIACVASALVNEPSGAGLILRPFRAMRPTADGPDLARLLSPPYDVISDADRAALIGESPDNAVTIVAPVAHGIPGEPAYLEAAAAVQDRLARGIYAVDAAPALYVYEMAPADGPATRGLLGAVELRDPADGVILPHEDVMAGPVADRLALMTATQANLEPIYLIYDGSGAAAAAVRDIERSRPVATTTTGDGTRHRLWSVTDPDVLAAIADDLAPRRAVIADGHHRYATYRELQRIRRAESGAGPWDSGLTLLVSSADHGPSVHPIHRVLPGLTLADTLAALPQEVSVVDAAGPLQAAQALSDENAFGVVLTDGDTTRLVLDRQGTLAVRTRQALQPGEPDALADLDITVLHRVLVSQVWSLPDDVTHVGYAHDVAQAVTAARESGGVAVLMRPTPAAAVIAVASAGARMPRKSTLFTPKPASGLVMRRFADG
jgi:uncharacterized protein (DUF1015 family)